MTIKQEIHSIIINNPKHFSKIIRKNSTLCQWVEANSSTSDINFAAKIYSALYSDSGTCTVGNHKKFRSINDGFGFCGKSSVCQCNRQSVSEKVSTTKSSRTKKEVESENIKRVNTNLARYGVTNVGQTMSAKLGHDSLYKNIDKVAEITNKIKKTKLDRYGTSGFNNRKKATSTNLAKYGVQNTWSLNENKQNPNLEKLKNKELLQELFPKYSVEQIALLLGVHAQTVYYYLGMHELREPYKSTFEQEILLFLKENGITNVFTNTRKIIGKELDIFIPDAKLAIEYNGEYWHHQNVPHINKTYHYDKFLECESNGITLLTIFGNSWKHKKDIWKQKILAKLGLAAHRVYARNTTVVELQAKDTKKFLNDYHIQGYCTSQLCYGLEEKGTLVAVMTFSKNRAGIGKNRGEDTYELVRYATAKNVVAGASKLLHHFIKTQKPKIIISYSDNLYSTGSMYKKLGFALEGENKVGYWYYDPKHKKQYHRYNFTKHKLVLAGFDPTKTENQIMSERGFLKIWDCGSRTWIKQLT